MANERLDARIDNLGRRVTKVDHRLSDKIDDLDRRLSEKLDILTGQVSVLINQNSAMIEMLGKALAALGAGNHSVSDPAESAKSARTARH